MKEANTKDFKRQASNKPQRTESLSGPYCAPALPAADEPQHRQLCCFEGCASGVSMKSRFKRRDHRLRFLKSSFPKASQACPPWSHLHVPITIRHLTQLPSGPNKLVRPPDTQPRQHHTHSSVCKVVLHARASARRCAPTSPMLFERRLCGLCEH
jgi:hypothetical protein